MAGKSVMERDWQPILEPLSAEVIDIAEPPRMEGRTILKSSLGCIPLTLARDIRPKQPDMQDREGTLGDEFSA
jgi:hypothetical protein